MFPWAALVAAIDCHGAQQFPKHAYRGRPGISTRILIAVESAWTLHQPGMLETKISVSARLEPMLRGRSIRIAAGLQLSATAHHLPEAQRAPVEQRAHSLCQYTDCLHNTAYLAAGFPMSTGMIERACRHLGKNRMEVTGIG
jgi:hypothetical protein